MPDLQKDGSSRNLESLNRRLQYSEQKIKNLEKQVSLLSRKSTISGGKIAYQSPPKRRLGWGLVWLSIFLFIGGDFFGLRFLQDLLPGPFWNIIRIGVFIAGVVLILSNPKCGMLTARKADREPSFSSRYAEEKAHAAPAERKVYAAARPAFKFDFAKKISKSTGKVDLESRIGAKWFTIIGIISLVIGIAYFLKYAFDHEWIGPTGRVVIGIIGGIILLVLGRVLDRKHFTFFARTLSGGGFAVIYGSIYAAYNFYQLISLTIDIVLLSIVVILTVIFALRYNSVVIASTAFILGYITAYLTGESNIHTLVYTAVLTLGLCVLVYKKGWQYLGLAGMIATYIIHGIWLKSHPNDHLTHLIFLAVYLIMFGFMALRLKNYIKLQVSGVFKKSEVLKVPAKILVEIIFAITFFFAYFSNPVNLNYPIFYLLLAIGVAFIGFKQRWSDLAVGGVFATYLSFLAWHEQNATMPKLFLYTSIFIGLYFLLYTILSYLLKDSEDRNAQVSGVLLMLSNAFFSYGIMYFEMEKNYDNLTGLFTVGVSAVYMILTYLYAKKNVKTSFFTSLALTVTFLTLAIPIQFNKQWITISWAVEAFVLVLLGVRFKNPALRVLGYIVAGIAAVKTAFVDSSTLAEFSIKNLAGSTRFYVFLVTIILFYLSSIMLYRNKKNVLRPEMMVAAFYSVVATALTSFILYLEAEDWTSLWWALQIIIVMFFSLKLKKKELRYASYLLAAITSLRLIISDTSLREFILADFWGSKRTFVFLAAIITFYISSVLLDKNKTLLVENERNYSAVAYTIAATALTTVLLALEFEKKWMSVAWAVQAIILLIIGFGFKKRIFRQLGILLFGITILKVFIFDLSGLEIFYRIMSFIGLGVILLIAAYVYHKYRDRIKGVI